jgi:hypothetical protein
MLEVSYGLRRQGRTLGRRGDIGHPSYLAPTMDLTKSIFRYCLYNVPYQWRTGGGSPRKYAHNEIFGVGEYLMRLGFNLNSRRTHYRLAACALYEQPIYFWPGCTFR